MPLFFMLIALCLCWITLQADFTFDQFMNNTPKTYGMLMTIHQSDVDRMGMESIERNINFYVQMQCSGFEQLLIVPEQGYKIKTTQSSSRKVLVTQSGWLRGTFFRFYLHENSSQNVYLSLDVGLNISCQSLTQDFEKWRQHSIGMIGHIMTYAPVAQDYQASTTQNPFSYNDVDNQFFSVAMAGASWIPTHFLKLITHAKLPDINYIRSHGSKTIGCQDLGLNFIITHLYPEILFFQLLNKDIAKQIKISKFPTKQLMAVCTEKFTQYLGYSPIRIYYRSSHPQVVDPYTQEINKYSVYLKYKYYESVIAYYMGKQSIFTAEDEKYFAAGLHSVQQFYFYSIFKHLFLYFILPLSVGYILANIIVSKLWNMTKSQIKMLVEMLSKYKIFRELLQVS